MHSFLRFSTEVKPPCLTPAKPQKWSIFSVSDLLPCSAIAVLVTASREHDAAGLLRRMARPLVDEDLVKHERPDSPTRMAKTTVAMCCLHHHRGILLALQCGSAGRYKFQLGQCYSRTWKPNNPCIAGRCSSRGVIPSRHERNALSELEHKAGRMRGLKNRL